MKHIYPVVTLKPLVLASQDSRHIREGCCSAEDSQEMLSYQMRSFVASDVATRHMMSRGHIWMQVVTLRGIPACSEEWAM